MRIAVTAINRQIQTLARVLNGPSLPSVVSVRSSRADVPIDVMTKRQGETTYVFTVGMRNAPTRGSFEVKGLPGHATANVLGESRRIKIENGRFDDDFRPYDVHLYAVSPSRTEQPREEP